MAQPKNFKTLSEEFLSRGDSLGKLLGHKNASYGSSAFVVGRFFSLLWPQGIPPERMRDSFILGRIFDKIMRIAHAPSALQEDPWTDLAGYALIGAVASSRGSGNESDNGLVEDRLAEAIQLAVRKYRHERIVPEPTPIDPHALLPYLLRELTSVISILGDRSDADSQ